MKKDLIVKGKNFNGGKPIICVPVMERAREEIVREVRALTEKKTEMVEWRVDAFEACEDLNEVRELLREVKPFVEQAVFLFTFRTKKQGGSREIAEEKLKDLYEVAAESGCADFIDLEFFELNRPVQEIRHLQKMGVRIIASHHDFDETPQVEVMDMLLQRMTMGGADIVKLAVMPNKVLDVLDLLAVTSQYHEANRDTPIITMSMGKMGLISRLAGEAFGTCVTFSAGKYASAPGQIPMDDLRKVLDIIHESGKENEEE